MMGFIVDNTRTRWGKFRPWIGIGTIINAVILVLLFRGPDLSGFAQYAYYSVMYILWGMTYTVLDIPYYGPCCPPCPPPRRNGTPCRSFPVSSPALPGCSSAPSAWP